MGAWLMYGLGTENQDLPGYITINPPPNFGGAVNYGSAFLPAHYQGTRINDSGFLPNLKAQTATSLQRRQIDLVQSMNRDLGVTPGAPDQLEGVIQSYELAFKMQGKVPELLDISKEPQHVLDAYGVKPGPDGAFTRQCLMARRLSEAGVRFVEICQPGWDHHTNLHKGLIKNCAATDQPTAALLADLEQRGMLEKTLVVWLTDFGRTPKINSASGRDHWASAGFIVMAGAGVPAGSVVGAPDDEGGQPISNQYFTENIVATIYKKIGLPLDLHVQSPDGRPVRLIEGEPIREWV